MPELPQAVVLPLVGLSVFLAGLTNGMTGMGLAILMGAGLALVVDARLAIVLMTVIVPITTIAQLVKHRSEARAARRVWPVFLGGIVGVPLGVTLLVSLPSRYIALLLGIFTLLFVATSLRRVLFRIRPQHELVIGPLVGLTAGVANGVVGVSGPILASYLLALGVHGATFAFTIQVLFLAMSSVRLVGLVTSGEMTARVALVGLGLLVPAMVGQQVGFWMQEKVSREVFFRGVLVVMALAGVSLINRGLGG